MINLEVKLIEINEEFVYIELRLMIFGYRMTHSKIGLNRKMVYSTWIKDIDFMQYLHSRTDDYRANDYDETH